MLLRFCKECLWVIVKQQTESSYTVIYFYRHLFLRFSGPGQVSFLPT